MLYTGFKKFAFFFLITFYMVCLYMPHSQYGVQITVARDLGMTLGVMACPFTWVIFYLIDKRYPRALASD